MRRWIVITGVGLLALSSASAGAAPRALPPRLEASVPSGFTDSLVATVAAPTTVVPLPDGRVVVLEKGSGSTGTGRVRVIQGGVLLPGEALSRSVCAASERGMLGFAVDPAFGTNGFVYLYYSRPNGSAPGGCVNRVSRFTMTGNVVAPASEVVLVDNIGSAAGNHNGGDLEIGNDGFLYISVGDGGCNPRGSGQCAGGNTAAQDLSLLNGKILRVDRSTGFAAPGNPIDGASSADCRIRGNTSSTPTSWCRELFAWGLRNPWRFAFDPNTGATRFNINDVGQDKREEIDRGILGANYGWNNREGRCAQSYSGLGSACPPPAAGLGYTQPIGDYSHDAAHADFGGDYITGGAFVPDGAWPVEYDGGYLYADGDPGKIYFRSAAGAMNLDSPFAQGAAGVSDLAFVMEPSGWALYYVSASTGAVRKIVRTTSTASPPGPLAYTPLSGPRRVYDTRGLGADTGQMRAGTTRLVDLQPPTAATRAALINITLVRPEASGFITAWMPRTTRPASSNINAPTGQIAANASIVPVDADGNVVLFTSVTTDVVVDVLGFFSTTGGSATAGRLVSLGPTRAVDTRSLSSGTNDYTRIAVGGDTNVNVPLAGSFGVDAGSAAVVLVVTALSDSGPGSGHVSVFPGGGEVPSSSNVNVNGDGDRGANLVVVPLGADGSVDLRLHQIADVIVDVVGTFTGAGAPSSHGGLFMLIPPAREVDTRIPLGFGRLAVGSSATRNPASVPDDAIAVAQNITITRTASSGFITAYPAGLADVPIVSNGNATAAEQTRAVLSITSLGGGSSSYFASMSTDVVVDVTGWFTPVTS